MTAAVVAIAACIGGVVAAAGPDGTASAASGSPTPATAKVTRGRLSDSVALDGTLTYRARPDGAPHAVINRAGGTYTALPDVGDRIGCGAALYRVDDDPVLLLCGTVPGYRDLEEGDEGRDVRQLNRNLRRLGHDHAAGVRLRRDDDARFTWRTTAALRHLQRARGLGRSGQLDAADVVVLPRSVRVAAVRAPLGGAARPGATVAQATSDALEVQASLAGAQQGLVRRGARAQVTLPGNRPAAARVDRIGRVARTAEEDDPGAEATIPVFLRLDDPREARGLDAAPVGVEITTEGEEDALSVPVTALVGRPGGGFAVEVVRPGGGRASVAVRLGLFDATGGRVAVRGPLRAGDDVVVPAS
ncbi:peptidoglycan-binding protein [Patulibacter americanus]|uniref:peptidoglycan-binding protein n=1 Tax=Patulibacter americanus TaxID=588672 RepID=UPI00146A58EE|nr:peptidoglycan-binding protein [Patulibacter americanus]